MTTELMVINPIRRKRKLSAKQRKYFGKRRSSRRRVTRARRNPVVAAPASYSRSKRRRRARSFYKRRVIRAYRGAGGISGIVTGTLVPAGIGAAGAIVLDMAWGRLPIPDALKTGIAAPITRIGLALALGYGVGMVAGKSIGNKAMAGAVLVTVYDLMKAQIAPSVPAQAATGFYADDSLGYYSSAHMAGVGRYVYD